MLSETIFIEGIHGPALLWAITYATLLFIYFTSSLIVEFLSKRQPNRRIQIREGSNVTRDIKLSVVSLATVAFYVSGGLYLQAKGYVLFAPWELTWWSFAVTLFVSVVVYDTWFYWFHRLMHTKLFYPIHARHHISIAPRAWSCNNDSLLGTFFEQSYFLIVPLVLPIPALVLVVHKIWDQIACAFGHAGYEFFAGRLARSPWPGVCTTYHDQHHSSFKCNYANTFTYWDRIMGTLHPSYEKKVLEFEKMNSPLGND